MHYEARVRIVVAAALVLGAQASCGGTGENVARGRGLSENVSRRVTVAEDLTVFTMFSLLNAAGYDLENRPQMHPVRVKVRAELARRLDPALRQRLQEFYAAHSGHADPWTYTVVAEATAGPPTFVPSADWEEIGKDQRFADLSDLHQLLPAFYASANIPAVYATVRSDYVDYIRAYETEIRREVVAVLTYCRIQDVEALGAAPPGERSEARVVPNLLDSYEHAFSFELGGRFVSVEGPQTRLGYNPHEFVHAVTNPVVYAPATRALADRLRPVMEEAARALGNDASFGSPEAFVDENLVRAISLRYLVSDRTEHVGALARSMTAEYRSGYILERFFWEQLAGYEASSADLRTFFPTILSRLDPEAELLRWREARAKEPPRQPGR